MLLIVVPILVVMACSVIVLVASICMSGLALLFGRWVMVVATIVFIALGYAQWKSDVAFCKEPPVLENGNSETSAFNCDGPSGYAIYTYLFFVQPISAVCIGGSAIWLWVLRGRRPSLMRRLMGRLGART
jgi:hypothetical protein